MLQHLKTSMNIICNPLLLFFNSKSYLFSSPNMFLSSTVSKLCQVYMFLCSKKLQVKDLIMEQDCADTLHNENVDGQCT